MSDKPNNPPAFPLPNTYCPNGEIEHGSNGMTLRDYFAAQAIQGMITNDRFVTNVAKKSAENETDLNLSLAAYEIADAMLKAREGEP